MAYGLGAILELVGALKQGMDAGGKLWNGMEGGSIGAMAADLYGQMLDMAANDGQLSILQSVDVGTIRDAINASIYEEDDAYSVLAGAVSHEEAVGDILEEIAGQIEEYASDYREGLLDAGGEDALE